MNVRGDFANAILERVKSVLVKSAPVIVVVPVLISVEKPFQLVIGAAVIAADNVDEDDCEVWHCLLPFPVAETYLVFGLVDKVNCESVDSKSVNL